MKTSEGYAENTRQASAQRSASAGLPFYERGKLCEAADEGLRPGGFRLTSNLLEKSGLNADARILDIGCGMGDSLMWMKSNNYQSVFGVDSSMQLLKEALKQGVPAVHAFAESLPFAANSLDGVLLECTLSIFLQDMRTRGGFSHEPACVLQEIDRILRPNGYLLISDLYARNPEHIQGLKELDGLSCLRGLLDLAWLQTAFVSMGYQVCLLEDHSDELKNLDHRLCSLYGSRQEFLRDISSPLMDPFDLILRIGRAKPGYFTLLLWKHGAGQPRPSSVSKVKKWMNTKN